MKMHTDNDVPDSGAAFTFGRSRFAENLPGKFWIRNDPILQISCGDEHTAFLTASGRVFTFGSNEWGQCGHGHTHSLTKPTCVQGLKSHRATVLACGRSHTLVATDSGYIYGFGANSEGQLGSSQEYSVHTSPIRIQGFDDVIIKMLSGGAEHSLALTDKGVVYVWGNNSEGQIGIELLQCLIPTELKFDCDVMCISAGYYHSAFVTVDGSLYTCGENESGKLGICDLDLKRATIPQLVSGIQGRIVYVSCGGNHTVVLTANGKAYSFGSGFCGQLGIGDRILETYSPRIVNFSENVKVARVNCGESHTAFLTDTGYLYTCGDRRHGKIGLLSKGEGTSANLFHPTLLNSFKDFQVQQVSCGGCHMLILAIKRKSSSSKKDSRDSCPTRKREIIEISKLSPSQNSNMETPKNLGSVQSLKSSNRNRLPSVTKSPVWYVPLERVGDPSKEDKENFDDDDVLSKLEYRCSFLCDEVQNRMRHVDSDVESDNSEEIPELNKTNEIIANSENGEYSPEVISSVQDTKIKKIEKSSPSNKSVQKSLFYDVDDDDKLSTTSSSKSANACTLL